MKRGLRDRERRRGDSARIPVRARARVVAGLLAVMSAVGGCRRLPPPEPPPAADATTASQPAADSPRAGDRGGGFIPPTGPPPRPPASKPAIPNEPVEVLWTQLHGARVRYRVAGPETAKTIVLLHGANYSSQTWEELGVLQRFAHAGYRVYAFDLPGYGESGKVGVDPGDWLNDLLQAMDIRRPALVAPSMSGRYAFPLVTSHPDAVRAFIAVAPVAITEYADRLEAISVPTLGMWGANDRVVPMKVARTFFRRVRGARQFTVSNAGHAFYMNHTATFVSGVLEFLAEVDGVRPRGGG